MKQPDSNKILPNKLSKLIRIAVRDAKKAEVTPGYRLDMTVFHQNLDPACCSVCMAGAVMAFSLNAPKEQYRDPNNYNASRKLSAIDAARVGDFSSAFYRLGQQVESREQQEAIKEVRGMVASEYQYSGSLFRAPWDTYLKAAAILEKVGL